MSEAAAVSSDGRTASWWDGIRPYFRTMPFVAFLLGISSGFPLTLLLATMTYWLSKVGIEKSTIGFAIGLTTPYTLKFPWPLVDKLPCHCSPGGSGSGEAGSSSSQRAVRSPLAIGCQQPRRQPWAVRILAIIVAFLSATQDIVIDAYRIEILSDAELPHGTAMNQFGYRTGNLIAGAGTIYLASTEGAGLGRSLWPNRFRVLPAAIGALLAGPGRYVERHARGRPSLGAWLKECGQPVPRVPHAARRFPHPGIRPGLQNRRCDGPDHAGPDDQRRWASATTGIYRGEQADRVLGLDRRDRRLVHRLLRGSAWAGRCSRPVS